jgi:hopene-associated glycosyltransferase HpnB
MILALGVLAAVSLVIWIYLVLGRGLFWAADQELEPDLPDPAEWPGVVALVPARNEAGVIGETLDTLLEQDYPGLFQVILIDDHSEDGTARVARKLAKQSKHAERLHVVESDPLPSGWSGKMWALGQGWAHAQVRAPEARYLWLTDADIAHWLQNLRDMVAKAEADKLDLVSVMPLLSCESWWERLLIPPFVFFFQKLYPFRWVNNPKRQTAAASGGSILVNLEALNAAGDFRSVKGELIDDCALAARIKAVARKRDRGIWLGLGPEAESIRPYDELSDIWRMVARSAYTQLGCSPLRLLGTVFGMCLAYLLPPIAVLTGAYAGMFLPITDFGAAFGAVVCGMTAWGLMALAAWPTYRRYGQPVALTLLLPLPALLYTLMTVDSARRHIGGRGGEWKGRTQATMVGLEDQAVGR